MLALVEQKKTRSTKKKGRGLVKGKRGEIVEEEIAMETPSPSVSLYLLVKR